MKLRPPNASIAACAAIALWAMTLAIPRAFASPIKICNNLLSTRSIDPAFSDLEKRLACGQGSGDENVKLEWKFIPLSQRRFQITTFLQARGYDHPRFEFRNGTLWIDPGSRTRVTAIHVSGAPENPGLDFSRKQQVIGAVLTPTLLDNLKSWTRERLRAIGYACPKIDLTGNPDTGAITLEIQSGARDTLAAIEQSDVPGLMHGLFRRYDAFDIGQWFNGDALTLTENRIVNEGQVQSYKLSVDHCEDGKAYVRDEVITGKPRLLTLGIGASTEGIIIGTAEWKDTRLGNTASLLDLRIAASTLQQNLSASGNWYFLDRPSRLYLQPVISTDHENQNPYETITEEFSPSFQTTLDTTDTGFQFGIGPNYEIVSTLRGSGAPLSHFLFLESTIRTATHSFDFYQTSPRTGMLVNLTTDLSDRHAFSDMYAQRFQLNFETLWNFSDYSPPLLVFGVRGAAVTTITDTGNAFTASVPPPLRQYLGGSNNLRGFGLLELPEDQIGRLSSVSSGFETRLANVLPWGIQPIAFVDIGALGADAFDLDPPIYWSPGIGVRVQSPIGVFRGSLAHGYLTGNPDPTASHFQLFLSYGEEF